VGERGCLPHKFYGNVTAMAMVGDNAVQPTNSRKRGQR
jgi:hypothetical protein